MDEWVGWVGSCFLVLATLAIIHCVCWSLRKAGALGKQLGPRWVLPLEFLGKGVPHTIPSPR